MNTIDGCAKYVDEVLSSYQSKGDDPGMLTVLREEGLGEYEPGIEPKKFQRILEGLEVNDVVEFHFKKAARWAMIFLGLFTTRRTCFEYVENQQHSLKDVKRMAMTNCRYGSSYRIKCRVRDVPISKEHNIDWMIKYLGVCLKDVAVEKPK